MAINGSGRKAFRLAAGMLACLFTMTGPAQFSPVSVGLAASGDATTRFIMTASDGRTITDEDLSGKHLLVFFGYTHCPDICPTGLQVIAEVMDLLDDAGDEVQPLFITLDPARDTQAVLAEYVANFHPRILGLTGPQGMVDHVAKGYRVKHVKVSMPEQSGADAYSIDHSASIFHMGPDGQQLGRFPPGVSAEEIAEAIRKSTSG